MILISGLLVEPEVILSSLNYILKDESQPSEFPLGILTTGERNKWAETRQHLENIGNKEALQAIDSALFAVALDHAVVEKNKDVVRWFLHSDGKNRYGIDYIVSLRMIVRWSLLHWQGE